MAQEQMAKKVGENMKDSFLLVSLEGNKAKKLAEVISNDSCRKILDYLSAKKDATESEMSKDLKIPISTIHYNIKALQDANLVVVEEFHYSQKGKEMNHYSLANKFIIIAPKQDNSNFMESLKKVLPITIISVAVAAIMQAYFWITTSASKASFAMQEYGDIAAAGTTNGGAEQIAPKALAAAPDFSRPFMQTDMVAYFLIGAVSVIIIYFIYELIRKK